MALFREVYHWGVDFEVLKPIPAQSPSLLPPALGSGRSSQLLLQQHVCLHVPCSDDGLSL